LEQRLKREGESAEFSGAKAFVIPKAPRLSLYPLTPSQQSLYFQSQLDPTSLAYNMPGVFRFGKQPENHVVISLSMGHFCELLLLTRAHYLAWLTASYSRGEEKTFPTQEPEQIPTEPQEPEMAMF